MATKLYFHQGNGSEPSPTTVQSTALPVGTTGTNLVIPNRMTLDKGVAQFDGSTTTLAQTAQQSRIVSAGAAVQHSPRLLAQTIAAATWTWAFAAMETNAKANVFAACALYVWRPSTNAKVGTIYDSATQLGTEFVVTTETGIVVTFAGSSLAVLDGDFLVFEAWIVMTQAAATSYTVHYYVNGTTDPVNGTSTSDAASYLSNPNTLTFYVPDDNDYYYPRPMADEGVTVVQL